jgi:tripartite-type tricarboxylate transporter receptor subunit TctC
MNRPRRRFLHLAAGALALPAISRIARAQAYPTRPITIVVPFPAGGALDVFGRILAERMRASLTQNVIIENVGGASGGLGVALPAQHLMATRSSLAIGARTSLTALFTRFPTTCWAISSPLL